MASTLIAQLDNPAALQLTSKRLATVVSVLLMIACVYLLVEITWMFFAPNDQSAASVSPAKSTRMNTQSQQANFRQLTAANIFGVSDKAVVAQPRKAPVTRLNLTLKGVLAAIPMNLANAIIAQGRSGKEENFGIGDKIPGGVVLKEIYPDYVVLERNGRDEILKLQRESGVDGAGQSRGKSLYNARASSTSASSPGAALKEIRSNILKNPTSFGQYALPVVVKKNGKQIGYRLKPQQQGDLLAELGIQSSDIIIQINGVKLDKPQNGISALRKLSTAKNLDIIVQRNGAEVPINISL
jgi:general secretion pathway protein C